MVGISLVILGASPRIMPRFQGQMQCLGGPLQFSAPGPMKCVLTLFMWVFSGLLLRCFPTTSEAQAFEKTRSFSPKILTEYLQPYATSVMTGAFPASCSWASVFELFKQRQQHQMTKKEFCIF